MKTLAALLAVFLVFFFLGCQESSITDPGTIEDNALAVQNHQNATDKDMISAYPGLIKVFESVFDPTHPQNGGDQIIGNIRFDHSLIPKVTDTNNPGYTVRVKFYFDLAIDAKCALNDDFMKVVALSDKSIDFPWAEHSAYKVVEETLRVSNTCCGRMDLVLKFKVDRDGVGLLSTSLKKVSGWVRIGAPD